nr:unnamed protein product [Spirometra erinaceieuropaei]
MADARLLEELEKFATRPGILIMGDFNAPHIDWSSIHANSSEQTFDRGFLNTALKLFLTQHVMLPTRVREDQQANCLDLVLTKSQGSIDEVSCLPHLDTPVIETVQFTEGVVLTELLRLKESKSPGPGEIPAKILKELADELSKPLSMLFHTSFETGYLPPDWKSAWITPLYKGGSRVSVNIYRSVSLTSICFARIRASMGARKRSGASAQENGDSAGGVKMEKTIGLVQGITILIGSIIGSGIFVSPTGILVSVKSVGASLVLWVACGTMIHRSGGDYAYILEAFGPFFGFLRLWVEVVVVRPAILAVIAKTFAKYMIQPIFPDCDQPEMAVTLLAAACLLLITFINCYSARLATRVQDLFTYGKLIAIAMIIGTGFAQMGLGRVDAFKDAFEGSDWSLGSIATGFYSGLFAYTGWNFLNCMIEEMKNPKRDLPISIVFSCLLVTAAYTFCNVAYFTTVDVHEILTTPAVAVTFAQRLYGPAWWIMSIFVALSTFGGINGSMMSTSRMFFVAGEENQMPRMLAFLHVHKLTPMPAVMFTSFFALIYLSVKDLYVLMNYLGFVQWLAIGLSVLIVIVFRVTRPDAIRPVRAPIIFPIIYVSCSAFLLIFSFIGAPVESLCGCAIIATAIPVYLIGVVWSPKPKWIQNKLDAITVGSQKILQLAPQS